MANPYQDIIPDSDTFQEYADQPLPHTVRVNTIKTTHTQLKERLEQQGFTVEQHPHHPDMLTVDENPAKTLMHWTGMFYMQETSAAIAPRVLNPEKGERVLDVAAAPGGKTTYLSQLMDNTGAVVANDKQGKRLRALHANTYRVGAVNVAATNVDGRRIPKPERLFDRVLVDAPCTGEATLREKNGEVIRDAEQSQSLQPLQRDLLDHALGLVKKEGVVVYSTCTFAPEENEAVVSAVLDTNENVELEAADLDMPHTDGVTEWQAEMYRSDMDRCVRLYPYHLDSGGGFVAKLRKT